MDKEISKVLLAEENKKLRADLENLRAQLKDFRREDIPFDSMEGHPDLEGILYHEREERFPGDSAAKYEVNHTMAEAVSMLAKAAIGAHEEGNLIPCKRMDKEQYGRYTDVVDLILSAMEDGVNAKKNGLTAARVAESKYILIAECVYDLSIQAEQFMSKEQVRPDDSRDLFSSIYYWAKEFEGLFDVDEQDYYEEIEKYGEKKLKEYFEKYLDRKEGEKC